MSTATTAETKARLTLPDTDLIPALRDAFTYILKTTPPNLTTAELADVLAYAMASCIANCKEAFANDTNSSLVSFN
jgi:hypothetical protein